ncbi:PspC domain-containing protein [Aeribacillus alveayuensis]|uniref:Phage shock protein PspC (Stress-responsive transcriptional regulator) n=1 Tax=Aeribacillus alveayuensis TaxID=279215 RepID=A0ABT9VLX1_9BACI|nr:phage shock protein PspC (stress-responsive transcriptional regulator) [Bacillus alveayuensis]
MKRLYRSRNNSKLAGVLGGIAEYFQLDPAIVRLVFVILLVLTTFVPFGLIYLAAMVIIPEEKDVSQNDD